MDPSETLRLLRKAVMNEDAAGDGSYAAEIVEHFQALDAWLTKGGFLPGQWTANNKYGRALR